MLQQPVRCAFGAAVALFVPVMAYAEDPVTTLPPVTVSAPRLDDTLNTYALDMDPAVRAAARDASSLLDTAPGAAVVRNGTQTGIVQLRGLSGDRVKVSVDGMQITPACPNHMDPPLHYATPMGLGGVELIAGITPVSMGGDSIAGTIVAETPSPQFGANAEFTGFGRLAAGYNGSNSGGYGVLRAGSANDSLSLTYTGERQFGQDLKFAGGEVRDSGFELTRHDLSVATRAAGGIVRLDAGQHASRDAGTPALPMDMIEDDANRLSLSYAGDNAAQRWEARAYYHDIEHLMDNYSLRPNANTAMWTFAPATSTDTGLSLKNTRSYGDQVLRFGAEFLQNDFDSYSQRLASGAQQDIIRDGSRDRLGLYGEWQTRHSPAWQTVVGVRSDTVMMDASDIVNVGAAPSAAVLADQTDFNSRDHDFVDHNWDAGVQLRHHAGPGRDYELGLARKTRSPSLLERYLWSPSNASAGQADGRTYLGNLDLSPEVSHQISLGAAWQGDGWRAAPSLFYNRVSDYIQGMPIARLDSNGNPVLQYTNIGRAELYGLDGSWRYRISDTLGLRGGISYVRGKNQDNGDNLYRIAPLRGDVNLDYQTGGWKHTAELRLVAEQSKVAGYNGETPTPGYGLVNLRTRWQSGRGLTVSGGIENIFDRYYVDHLGGVNRVALSDVAVGAHIPGAGRFVYLGGEYAW